MFKNNLSSSNPIKSFTHKFGFVSGVFAVSFAGLLLSGCAAKKVAKTSAEPEVSDTGESATGGIGLGTLRRVYFEFDKNVVSSDAAEILKKNADTIKKNPKMRVLVEGHCDERGTNEYNVALGERRAKAALDYLVGQGIARTRLELKSWGEERPLDPGHTESAWAKNRRAEFVILAK